MLLSYPHERVWMGTACFWPQGAGTVPQGGPALARACCRAQHAARLAQSEPHCVLPCIQALRWLQGLHEHTGAPVQRRGGREEMAPSLVPQLSSEEMPALLLGRGYGSQATQLLKPEPFSQQARSSLSPRLQHLRPCTKA